MRRVDLADRSEEMSILSYLAEEPLGHDERNPSIQPIEALDHPTDPTTRILALPLLRKYDDPPFETLGEILDCIWQVFEVRLSR